jgi:hypothetical protein
VGILSERRARPDTPHHTYFGFSRTDLISSPGFFKRSAHHLYGIARGSRDHETSRKDRDGHQTKIKPTRLKRSRLGEFYFYRDLEIFAHERRERRSSPGPFSFASTSNRLYTWSLDRDL